MASDDSTIEISIVMDDGSMKKGFISAQKAGEDAAQGVSTAFQRVGETVAGVFGGQLLVNAFGEIIDLAKELFTEAIKSSIEAEVAINKLNTSLQLTGQYTEATSAHFQELAESLQSTTTFSNDAVLNLQGLAITFSKTTGQAEKLVKAALDLSAATGVDANTALVSLSGTLSGTAGRFGKLFPELKSFTKAQLEGGAAVDYLASRLSGAAAAQTNTFAGSLIQLKNNFDDFMRSITSLIVTSPTIIKGIKFLSQELVGLAGLFGQFKGKDVFKDLAKSFFDFAQGVVTYVIAPLEYAGQVVDSIVRLWITGFKSIIFVISLVGDGVNLLLKPVVAFFKYLYALIQLTGQAQSEYMQKTAADLTSLDFTATTTSFDSLAESANGAYQSVNGLGESFKIAGASQDFLTRMQAAVETLAPLKTGLDDTNRSLVEMSTAIESVGDTFSLGLEGMRDSMAQLHKDGKKVFRDLGGQTIRTFVGGITNGMAAVGKALVTGQNLFEAFGKAMLAAIGQALVTEGGARILQGVARAFSSYGLDATAWGLISTGGAMAVAGGAMMALGGGGSGAGATTPSLAGVDGGGGQPSFDAGSDIGDGQLRPSTASTVTVQVMGDVLDSKESGLRIVEILNDAFKDQGARLATV